MFIKIDKERVINTDQLIAILPAGELRLYTIDQDTGLTGELALDENETILVMTREYIRTTSAIASYIIQLVDAADGFVEATDKPQELSLKSRIAILLRNQIDGMTVAELQTELHLHTDTLIMELDTALNELIVSNTITSVSQPDPDTASFINRYYHAGNQSNNANF